MTTEEVAIAETHPPERNVRQHPPLQIKELARAVEMFGQTRPIVIDETNMVLVGNGLVEAFKSLGRPTIRALRLPQLTDAEKTKLMLADNHIFDLGVDDHANIMAMLRELPDLDIPGYDEETLRRLTVTSSEVIATAVGGYGTMGPGVVQGAQARAIPDGSTDPGASAPTATAPGGVTCPRCGFVIEAHAA